MNLGSLVTDSHKPVKKHQHNDAVILEDDISFEELRCTVQNPEFNRTTNMWECQLAGEDGTYLKNGAWFPLDSLIRDPSRSSGK